MSLLESSVDRDEALHRSPLTVHVQPSDQGETRQQPRARMAHVVNSIKAGFRKLGGGVLVADGAAQGHAKASNQSRPHAYVEASASRENREGERMYGVRREGGKLLGVKRKTRRFEREGSSFDVYLSSLPKMDPVDRTVNWLFSSDQPPRSREREERETSFAVNDRKRHHRLNTLRKRVVQSTSHTGSSSWQQQGDESSPYETSLSYYESARGTGGRGTPPTREDGQPRLDDLFRELQVRREREARKKLAEGEKLVSTKNIPHIPATRFPGNLAGMSHDLLPFVSPQQPPLILHKNSSYYNQCHAHLHDHTHHCEWGQCRMKFLSSKDLLSHLHEHHFRYLPTAIKVRTARTASQQSFVCEWRGCGHSGRGFTARYKLLMHVKMTHVQSS